MLDKNAKYPIQHGVDQMIAVARDRVDCTDGVVILIDHKTKKAGLGSIGGDLNQTISMLEEALGKLKRMKKKTDFGRAGLILPG